MNRIGGVMVSVLTYSAVDHWFEPRSGQAKNDKIGICCFSAKHTALRSWSGATCLSADLFQCVGLVQIGPHHYLIEN